MEVLKFLLIAMVRDTEIILLKIVD